jgi:hypothetical protein
MKDIGQFVKKPQLIEVVLDSEDIINEFGEPVIFYMKDYVDITTYFEFYKFQNEGSENFNTILRRLILNAEGNTVLKDDEALPVQLAVGALSKINENLGKLNPKSSMSETGNPQG